MSPIKPFTPIYNQRPTVCLQSKPSLRSITNAPRYVSNQTIHSDVKPMPLGMSPIKPSTPIYNQCPTVCLQSNPPLRSKTNVPRYVSNQTLHSDL